MNNTCQAMGLGGVMKSHGKKKILEVEKRNISIRFIMQFSSRSFPFKC